MKKNIFRIVKPFTNKMIFSRLKLFSTDNFSDQEIKNFIKLRHIGGIQSNLQSSEMMIKTTIRRDENEHLKIRSNND